MTETGTRAAGYVFDTGFGAERERLALGEELWDAGTRHHLSGLGVRPGWRCLEIGAGRGSVARWLRERVGPGGQVVAADLRLDRLDWLRAHDVTLLAHDVTTDELPGNRFDLVHARLVVAHLAARRASVARMCRALRPGGRLVLEDTDVASLFSHPYLEGFQQAVKDAAYAVMRASGHHPRCGLLDAELMENAGLLDVRAEGRAVVVRGGSDAARWFVLWLAHLRPAMLAAGRVSAAEIDAAIAALGDPTHRWLSQVMITVTGRKSEGALS